MAWYHENVHAANASIYVGGDTTLAEVLRYWENHLPTSLFRKQVPDPESDSIMAEEMPTTVHLIDSRALIQSVIYAGQFVSELLLVFSADELCYGKSCRWWTIHCPYQHGISVKTKAGHTVLVLGYPTTTCLDCSRFKPLLWLNIRQTLCLRSSKNFVILRDVQFNKRN